MEEVTPFANLGTFSLLVKTGLLTFSVLHVKINVTWLYSCYQDLVSTLNTEYAPTPSYISPFFSYLNTRMKSFVLSEL